MLADVLLFTAMTDAPNRIRELRIEAKLSQQALGDLVGVSKMTISDLERGNMRLDLEYMRRIARALGATVADLLPRSDNADALSIEERALLNKFRAINDGQRQQVTQVIDIIVPAPSATVTQLPKRSA